MQYKNIQIPNVHQKFYQKLFINFRDNPPNNLFLPFAKHRPLHFGGKGQIKIFKYLCNNRLLQND